MAAAMGGDGAAVLPVFVCGQSCAAQLLQLKLGRVPLAAVAVLAEYQRARDPASGRFDVLPLADGRLPGLLLSGLTVTDLQRLDEVEREGTRCNRREVTVLRLSDGERVPAHAYLAATPSTRQQSD